MAEGWLKHYAAELELITDVFSAGSEKTFVKPQAVTVMREVGIDLSNQFSKVLEDLPDSWNFDVVMTVCDSANETCPVYPAKTTRLHVSFPDPSDEPLESWREVRDALGASCKILLETLKAGEVPNENALKPQEPG